jgi:hypothetical protein
MIDLITKPDKFIILRNQKMIFAFDKDEELKVILYTIKKTLEGLHQPELSKMEILDIVLLIKESKEIYH